MNPFEEVAAAFETAAKVLRKSAKQVQPFSDNGNGQSDYETMRRQKVFEYYVRNIKSKKISIDEVSVRTEKERNYIQRKIPQRTNHTKTFWAVDVLKFCCDEWGIDYPPEYYKQCERCNIAA